MKTPTEYDIEQLMHRADYDPVKAHEYYERHKHLKGRKRGSNQPPPRRVAGQHNSAKAKQKRQLTAAIQNLETKLHKLEALIKQKEHAEASENRKGKAKKERAAKEKDKPKTAAEKAKAARDNEKYRKKHRQELKNKAKSHKSGGGSSKGKTAASSKQSVAELKTLATKVKGQIAIAKAKLAAL